MNDSFFFVEPFPVQGIPLLGIVFGMIGNVIKSALEVSAHINTVAIGKDVGERNFRSDEFQTMVTQVQFACGRRQICKLVPEGMDVGTLIMAGLKRERVLDAVRVILAQHDRTQRVMRRVEDYEGGPVSKQLVRIVLSYVAYVNRTVWSKPA